MFLGFVFHVWTCLFIKVNAYKSKNHLFQIRKTLYIFCTFFPKEWKLSMKRAIIASLCIWNSQKKKFVWRCKTSLLLAPICLFLFFIVHLLVSKVIWNLNPWNEYEKILPAFICLSHRFCGLCTEWSCIHIQAVRSC